MIQDLMNWGRNDRQRKTDETRGNAEGSGEGRTGGESRESGTEELSLSPGASAGSNVPEVWGETGEIGDYAISTKSGHGGDCVLLCEPGMRDDLQCPDLGNTTALGTGRAERTDNPVRFEEILGELRNGQLMKRKHWPAGMWMGLQMPTGMERATEPYFWLQRPDFRVSPTSLEAENILALDWEVVAIEEFLGEG